LLKDALKSEHLSYCNNKFLISNEFSYILIYSDNKILIENSNNINELIKFPLEKKNTDLENAKIKVLQLLGTK